jgi:hypothetical protein
VGAVVVKRGCDAERFGRAISLLIRSNARVQRSYLSGEHARLHICS